MSQHNIGFFHITKDTPTAIQDRREILGARINQERNLEIFRNEAEGYLDANNNKCLVLHQADTHANPEVLEFINKGSGNSVANRWDYEGTVRGHLTRAGVWTNASSEEFKENFKNMADSTAVKQIEGLEPKRFDYKETDEKGFGPTSENFKEVTGYGDGKSIAGLTLAGLCLRYIQNLHKRLKVLEAASTPAGD